jgi:serine protease Do
MTNMNRVLFGLRIRNWLLIAAFVALAGLLAIEANQLTSAAQKDPESATATAGSGSADYAKSLSKAFREAAEKVLPSVVLVESRPVAVSQPPRGEREMTPDDDELFEGPFGDLFRNHPDMRRYFRDMPRGIPRGPGGGVAGSGSGVVIDSSGVILTNNHVVEGAGKVSVRLMDGREFDAADIKRDPKSDLAIIRIKGADNLKAAKLGDSDKMAVGDWVLALGDMFQLEGTVTAGIISAKGRPLGPGTRTDFLQTDAAINPGSSGGPLINLDAEVIGINTAIHTRTGANDGVGFAIPSNLAKWAANQLTTTGTVKRAYLGVAIQALTHSLADQFGVKVRQGILVGDVQPNSPAEKAGIKAGDLILNLDGKPVGGVQELVGMVDRSPVNSKVSVEILRDGKRVQIPVTLREQSAEYGLMSRGFRGREGKSEPAKVDKLGIQVDALTKDVAEQLGLKAGEGVVVTEVVPGSLADRAGLTTGTVITQVNRKPVKSAEDFKKALDAQPLSKGVLLLVRTAEGARFVAIRAD